MIADEIRLIRYMNANTRRFSFWLIFQDNRNVVGKKAKRDLIKFFESTMGPLGAKWNFESTKNGRFAIKADSEADVTMMLLRFHR